MNVCTEKMASHVSVSVQILNSFVDAILHSGKFSLCICLSVSPWVWDTMLEDTCPYLEIKDNQLYQVLLLFRTLRILGVDPAHVSSPYL